MAGFFRQGPMSTRQSPLFHAFAISRSPGGFWESMMRLNSGLDRPFTQRRCRLYEYTMSDDEKSLYEVWMEKDVEILAKRNWPQPTPGEALPPLNALAIFITSRS